MDALLSWKILINVAPKKKLFFQLNEKIKTEMN